MILILLCFHPYILLLSDFHHYFAAHLVWDIFGFDFGFDVLGSFRNTIVDENWDAKGEAICQHDLPYPRKRKLLALHTADW